VHDGRGSASLAAQRCWRNPAARKNGKLQSMRLDLNLDHEVFVPQFGTVSSSFDAHPRANHPPLTAAATLTA
jgi:hypothetical protein